MIETDEEYYRIVNLPSTKPFHVNTGDRGNVWYYLSHGVDKGNIERLVGSIDNCMTCKKNVSKVSGLFGPVGYALPFPQDMEINRVRETNKIDRGLNYNGTFLVTPESVKCTPRYFGVNPYGKEYLHLGLNLSPEYVTNESLSRSISPVLLKKLSNSSMDARLEEIVTHLQRVSDEGINDMDMFDVALKSPKLSQKSFWEYRINFAKKVQRYSQRFPNGKEWMKMDPFHRMHVKVFSLFYGGLYSHSENLGFKAASQLIDCSKDVYNGGSLIPFMNSRSNPETYMVGQVSRAIHENSVISRFTVSLAWESTSDLDLWVRTETGERIGHTNRKSKIGKTQLDFDANAVEVSTSPVENITLDDDVHGAYDVYVNNFKTRQGDTNIPFSVIIGLDGELETFRSTWDCRKLPSNSSFKKMQYVTTVYITRDMINKRNPPEMSCKQTRKFTSLLDNFESITGKITTNIVNMMDIDNRVVLRTPVRRTMSQRSVFTSFNTFCDIINRGDVSVTIRSIDFPPTVLTTHSCCDKVLKTSIIPNTYYERGKPPKQPNADKKYEMCRIDNSWCPSSRPRILSVVPLRGSTYNGFFCSIGGGRMPTRCNREWVIGAGMYPSDLKTEYHKFRDIWTSYHTNIYPSVPTGSNVEQAIGVFFHCGKTIRVSINGNETSLSV